MGCILIAFLAKDGFIIALRWAWACEPAATFCAFDVLCCVALSLSMAIILSGVLSTWHRSGQREHISETEGGFH